MTVFQLQPHENISRTPGTADQKSPLSDLSKYSQELVFNCMDTGVAIIFSKIGAYIWESKCSIPHNSI